MTPVQTLYRWFNDNPEATYKEALEAYEHCLELEKNEREKLVDDALTNYEIGWADRKKQFSLYEHKETITSADTPVSNSFLNSTSSQPQLYTEEQLKLAYMQGYNRGKDGNPNHMESYIEFIKQPKKD